VRSQGEKTSAIVTVSHVKASSGGIPGVQSLEETLIDDVAGSTVTDQGAEGSSEPNVEEYREIGEPGVSSPIEIVTQSQLTIEAEASLGNIENVLPKIQKYEEV
jgi:hypothetical protein